MTPLVELLVSEILRDRFAESERERMHLAASRARRTDIRRRARRRRVTRS